MFDLKKPCSSCPFLKANGKRFGLHPERIRDIAEATAFQCHNTVDYSADPDEDGEREGLAGDNPQQCFGLMSILMKERRPNLIMRLALATETITPDALLKNTDTYDTLDEAITDHQRG